MSCRIEEGTLGRHLRTLTLENDLLSTTLLVDKGADIYTLVHRASGIDLLWKAPWGQREPGTTINPSPSSAVSWMEYYGGGWQVLFPNGGDACTYKGADLIYHGEASTLPWSTEIVEQSADRVAVRLWVHLYRSPFRLERTVSLAAGSPTLSIDERIINLAGEPMEAMWSHHPALGAPFLSSACRIDTTAQSIWADYDYAPPAGRLQPNGRWDWPLAAAPNGEPVDLSVMPEQPGSALAYLTDFTEGWVAISNPDVGFGVAFSWPSAVFPHAWYWQELHGSPGYPWYAQAYTMAIEPASSIPGHGLVDVIERTASHLRFAPGETHTITLRATLYPISPGQRVQHVAHDGAVTLSHR